MKPRPPSSQYSDSLDIMMQSIAWLCDSRLAKGGGMGQTYPRLSGVDIRRSRAKGWTAQGQKVISGISNPNEGAKDGGPGLKRYKCPHVTSCVPPCYLPVAE